MKVAIFLDVLNITARLRMWKPEARLLREPLVKTLVGSDELFLGSAYLIPPNQAESGVDLGRIAQAFNRLGFSTPVVMRTAGDRPMPEAQLIPDVMAAAYNVDRIVVGSHDERYVHMIHVVRHRHDVDVDVVGFRRYMAPGLIGAASRFIDLEVAPVWEEVSA